MADLWGRPLGELVNDLQAKFGWGWGPTTVLHMLTDFGLAVKTDRHVLRSLHELGIWESSHNFVSQKEAISLNEAARILCEEFYGEITPQSLRQLDLLLMRLSLNGLVNSTKTNSPRHLQGNSKGNRRCWNGSEGQ